MTRALSIAVLCLCFMPGLLAHPGHGETGFSAGLLHPLTGLDHLLAMIAVGILAVRCGRRGIWIIPLSFIGCMLLGGCLAAAHLPAWGGEWAIAFSVLVFGVMAALVTPPRIAIASLVVGAFALVHGHAHVAEMQGNGLMGYSAGFLLATAGLHAFGIAFAILMTRYAPATVLRAAGATIAIAGVGIFMQLIV